MNAERDDFNAGLGVFQLLDEGLAGVALIAFVILLLFFWSWSCVVW